MRSALRSRATRYVHEDKMLGGLEVVRHLGKLVADSRGGKKKRLENYKRPSVYAYLYERHSVEKLVSGRRMSTLVCRSTPFHLG